MIVLALLALGVATALYGASQLQHQGYPLADRVCTVAHGMCDRVDVAIGVALIFAIVCVLMQRRNA
jgi:hypothetical protein